MKSTFLSRFTPSLMSPETLEGMFVQRHQLAEDLVVQIRESALTAKKHFRLLTGMRGIGKTHMVSLIYHRVTNMEDLRDKLLIAWLREEEWGVGSFLDLLLRIFRALEHEYPADYAAQLEEKVEALYQLSPDEAERTAAMLLREFVGDRTLLLLVENLDDVFAGLEEIGQKRFRDYIKKYSFLTILATAQSLWDGFERKGYPFYGVFHHQDLERLNLDQAVSLLRQIARVEGNQELESFIQTPTGRARVEAIHKLAGGNHRVYVIFYQFLTRKSLDELVQPFMQTLDELTPYYQSRMQSLSPQQRKIVEFLVDRRNAVAVKEIAQRCFMTHQTASSQLKKLLDMGYVRSEPIGRESFYELREVLMRFCLEVKKERGEPIRLFVDFLRYWYTRTELQQQLESLPHDAMEREYVLQALRAMEDDDEDPRVAAYGKDFLLYLEKGDFVHALQVAEKLVRIRSHSRHWFARGICLTLLGRSDEALASYNKAIELNPHEAIAWVSLILKLFNLKLYNEVLASLDKAVELNPNLDEIWYLRGRMLAQYGHWEEALTSFNKVIELDPNNPSAWNQRGLALSELRYYDEALPSFDKAIELDPNNPSAWNQRGLALNELEHYDEALASFDKVIELDPNEPSAWSQRGLALIELGHHDEALISFDKAIEVEPNDALTWLKRGFALSCLGRYEQALVSFDKATELNANDALVCVSRGVALNSLGRYEEALVSYDKIVELDPNHVSFWVSRGIILGKLERYDEALASCDKAIELDPKNESAWCNRGWLLGELGRYEEALLSCDKAIALGCQCSAVFFNRAIALLALNRWDDGITTLDDALNRFADTEEPSTEDTELIIRNLFDNTYDAAIWQTRITTLIELYKKYQVSGALATGLVREKSIRALMSEMVSDKAAQTWLEVWRELTSNYPEFQIPLRLLNAAVRYRQTKGDKRVLLSLPIEERDLLKPLLGINE